MIIKSCIFPVEPQEPAVTPQTILDMGYTREALADAMKTAEERGKVFYFSDSFSGCTFGMQIILAAS